MLPSSVRRVVVAAPPTTLLSNFAPTAARATTATANPFNPRNQQRRRYSSSKPSSPNDSSKGLPAGQMTASPAQSSKSAEKPAGERRKRKAKDNSTDALGKLPSVPSTHHVPPEGRLATPQCTVWVMCELTVLPSQLWPCRNSSPSIGPCP